MVLPCTVKSWLYISGPNGTFWTRELETHHGCEHAAEQKKDERSHHETDADRLVISIAEPPPNSPG